MLINFTQNNYNTQYNPSFYSRKALLNIPKAQLEEYLKTLSVKDIAQKENVPVYAVYGQIKKFEIDFKNLKKTLNSSKELDKKNL